VKGLADILLLLGLVAIGSGIVLLIRSERGIVPLLVIGGVLVLLGLWVRTRSRVPPGLDAG
jgi:hypothetical protein